MDNEPPKDNGSFKQKGADLPWKRPGQKSQDPNDPDPLKPDLEKWQESHTH
jgi:hypothetical protein